MNLHYAQLLEINAAEGIPGGKVRVGGAIRTVSLGLVPNARRGDELLLCDGIPISRVENNQLETHYVPGNTREA